MKRALWSLGFAAALLMAAAAPGVFGQDADTIGLFRTYPTSHLWLTK
jgi:hypothetical protein